MPNPPFFSSGDQTTTLHTPTCGRAVGARRGERSERRVGTAKNVQDCTLFRQTKAVRRGAPFFFFTTDKAHLRQSASVAQKGL